EPMFLHPDFRDEAIYAYALAAPAEESAFGRRQLEKRIDALAHGLTEEEEAAVAEALELRSALSGHAKEREAAVPAAVSAKVGRNDPCPCGSGKKYKKCCGSAA